jgi:ribosome-binding factor A
MPYKQSRTVKIAEEIRRELSDIIRMDVKDDRLSAMATVSRIDLTQDLKYAKVYISVFDDEREREKSIDALNHAASFIRTRLSRRMHIRTVPKLTFVLDNSISYSFEIEKKLKEVLPKDDE